MKTLYAVVDRKNGHFQTEYISGRDGRSARNMPMTWTERDAAEKYLDNLPHSIAKQLRIQAYEAVPETKP